jgi:DNA-binding LacI/PurR family transcriptional regulator
MARRKPRAKQRIGGAGSTLVPRLRSKAAQLAEYLRHEVQHRRIAVPLPGSREWSRQLGVSRRVFSAAVAELQREGWLTVHPRGVRLHPERAHRRTGNPNAPRVVRLLLFAAYRRHIHGYFETISTLQEQLHTQGLELKWESCTSARLRAIARQPSLPHELLILASVPPAAQRLFAASGKPAIVLGEVAPDVALPFVTADQVGAVRHATFRLLQRGFDEIILVHVNVEAAGIRRALDAFDAAVSSWPRQPVKGRRVPTPLDEPSLLATARRIASGVRGRTGIIVVAPIPIGLVVTALWHHALRVPEQVEVVALFHSPEAIRLFPPPAHYPSPVEKLVRRLTSAAVTFFDTGAVPPIAKTVAVELSAAGG